MTPERWQQVDEIFHATLGRPESDRAGFLADACAGDAELLREVQSLLAQPSVGGFLDHFAMAGAARSAGEISSSTLTGRRFGAYQVLSPIGAGGMGEVYRARDTKLGRDVAIKILPPHFTSDPDRLARFKREAQVLASLNHPHISAIYGLEDVDGSPALVLELIDGETLAERITRGPIPLADTLAIARQIADALEASHVKGIVHRDLKPANIQLTPDSVVKVLDFGLARLTSEDANPASTRSPTMTADGTGEGIILGTATYMSPEQAKGRPSDKRADVWAFGIVLYEMLTGRRAFEGETFSDVLAKVIEREPDWTLLPPATPPRLRELLRRCVRKDPKTRLQAIGDARVQIDELIAGAPDESITNVITPPRAQLGARVAGIAPVLLLVIAAALAVPAARYFSRAEPDPVVTRFEIVSLPTSDPVSFALSADGRQLAFVATRDGTSRLWLRSLDQVTPQSLAGAEGARYPFWKPDGRAIGFFADGKLKWIDLESKVLTVPADAPNGRGGTWNSDDVIVFAPTAGGGLMRVMARGGTPVPVTRVPAGTGTHRFPQFLPDGRRFLFLGGNPSGETQNMYVGSLEGGDPKRVLAAKSVAVFAPPASLLWVEEGVLVAQPFDPVRAAVSGEPIPVVQEVGLDEGVFRGAFAVSETGVLAHRASRGERRQLTWVDRAGVVLGTIGPPDENALSGSELAPDGQRVAVTRIFQGNTDVYLFDARDGGSSRFTLHPGLDTYPLWSPEGARVLFTSPCPEGRCVFEKAATGAGDSRQLLPSDESVLPLGWSPGGQLLLYSTRHPKTGLDLWAAPMAGDRKPVSVIRTPFDETAGQFSPNGRWVAYQSNESKPVQIYILPFPGPGGPRPVTTAGGSQPRWSPDGKELFYVGQDGRLMAVPIEVGADRQLELGKAVALFKAQLATGANINSAGIGTRAQYAVAPDGRFLINMSAGEATASPITVVLNWDTALKK